MYNEVDLRKAVLPIVEAAAPSDLKDRLQRELRRGYDSGSTHRQRRRHFNFHVAQWAKRRLVAAFDPQGEGLRGNTAWAEFQSENLVPATYGGQRAFYVALREAGYTTGHDGSVTRIDGVELAR